MPTDPPRQARAERTRAHILETAAVAYADRGYDGVSLNEVIRLAGITKGALYFHFESRDALALAVFRHAQQRLVAALAPALAVNAPALTRLREVLLRRAELIEEDPSLFAVVRLGIDLTLRHGAGSQYASFADDPLALFAQLVRDGQAEGAVREDLDAQAAAATIFAGVLGIDQAALMLADHPDLVRRTEQLLDVLVLGLSTTTTTTDERRQRP